MARPKRPKRIKIKKTGQPITIHLRQKDKQASKNGKTVINLQFIPHDVVILHPSFCIPLIVQDKKPLTLYILTDKEFYDLYDNDPDATKPKAKTTINTFLKLYPWKDKKTLIDKTLYKKGDEQANIKITYLKDMWPKKKRKASSFGKRPLYEHKEEWFIEADPKDFQGSIRAEVRDYYLNKDMGHVFRIELQPAALQTKLSANNLYDLSWLIYAEDNPLDPANPYLEAEDIDTQIFLKKGNDRLNDKQWVYPYKINGAEFNFEQAELPIENYHPVYVTDSSKTKLNLGHLTDVHVSSRQHAFKKSQAQVIHNDKTKDISPPIGDLVNVSFETLKDLMDQIGDDKDIDMLVCTGDLVDYTKNFDPGSTEIKNTGDLWSAMNLDEAEKNRKSYPAGLDHVTIYSLFKYFYDTYKKPIFLTSGNHEAYTVPYGISPRVFSKRKGVRANASIPADHNLTIYEAILMYGPHYHKVLRKLTNFQKENFNWFYNLFTPLTDYAFTFGDQTFVGLEWGDDESMLTNRTLRGGLFINNDGGVLPRASDSVTNKQLQMVDYALATTSPQKILFSHFTYYNYDLTEALSIRGEVNINNNFLQKYYTKYDHGSCKDNRNQVYNDWILSNKFDYTLSGHSHRAAIYETLSRAGEKVTPLGHEINNDHGITGTKVVVTACGGPIAVQNFNGEMKGHGLDSPSGTWINLNDNKIGLIKPKSKKNAKQAKDKAKQSQPRFCVALDYFDILESESKEKQGVFLSFESSTDKKNEFMVNLNPDLPNDVAFIGSLELKIVMGTSVKTMACPNVVFSSGSDAYYRAEFSESEFSFSRIEEKGSKNLSIFLSLKFKKDALSNRLGYKQYDFSSAWNLQVEVRSSKELVRQKYKKKINNADDDREDDLVEQMYAEIKRTDGYYIRRHERYGEIPNLKWYRDGFEEYSSYEEEITK
ncbi:MAG: metallophosphoesterase family protein [Gammaproteobacteria bacterium]